MLLVAVAAVDRATPTAAQLATGLSPPGGSAPSSGAPTALPPPPSGPFGLPSPYAPPNTLPYGPAPPTAPELPVPGLLLPPPGAGITTLQLYNPEAPAVLIQPTLAVGVRLTDNAYQTANDRRVAIEGRLIPGISISADTPRFKGVLTGQAEGDVYTPTANLNQVFANLYGSGTGIVVPDRLFVDLTSYLTQASTVPGQGFIGTSTLPRTSQTQVFSNTISPYLRQSFDGFVDTELRYRFGATNYGGVTTTTTTPSSGLANGVLNEGTFTAATGSNFERALSRLTVDYSNFNSNSTTRNEQVSALDDLEYRINPNISALGRIGYQNLRYPFAPAATFAGLTWLAGGRLSFAGNYGFISLEYGRVDGVYGFTGTANFNVTPTMTVAANVSQGISSPTQSLQTSLASSTLNPNGSIVDQYTGLPTAFYNPGLGLTNNVYREHLYNIGVTDQIGINNYSLYGYYINQQTLTPPITAPSNSIGAIFTYTRDIRPDLNGVASVSYARTTNATSISTSTPVGNTGTATADLGVNYSLARSVTGSVLYSFSYQTNAGVFVNGQSGSIVVNSLQLLLTKAF